MLINWCIDNVFIRKIYFILSIFYIKFSLNNFWIFIDWSFSGAIPMTVVNFGENSMRVANFGASLVVVAIFGVIKSDSRDYF